MSSLTLIALVQAVLLAGGENSYADAHKITTETGRPMVVLVGANWCPACKTMKDNVMPQIVRKGLFGRCVYTVVDLDKQEKLGQQLTNGGPIPQLIMFRKTNDGWKRKRLIGGQSINSVVKFIDDGVKLDQEDKEEKKASHDEDETAEKDRHAAREAISATSRAS